MLGAVLNKVDDADREAATKDAPAGEHAVTHSPSPSHTIPLLHRVSVDKGRINNAALFYDMVEHINFLANTPMSDLDLALHIHRYIMETEFNITRSLVLEFLSNSESKLDMTSISLEDSQSVFDLISDIIQHVRLFKSDPEFTAANVRAVSEVSAKRTILFESPCSQTSVPGDEVNSDAATCLFASCIQWGTSMGLTSKDVRHLSMAIHTYVRTQSVKDIDKAGLSTLISRFTHNGNVSARERLVDFVSSHWLQIREDDSCTKRALLIAHKEWRESTNVVAVCGPEDRDSLAGRDEVGPCLADSSPPSRESQSNRPREAHRSGSTDNPVPAAGEKRKADNHECSGSSARKNHAKARRRGHGSKLIPNKDAPIPTGRAQNDRTCLVDAVNAHLLESVPNHERESIIASLMSIVPSEGDTTIEAARGALKKYGISLNGVNKEFCNGNRAHNILKERGPRKLIIGLRLFDLKDTKLYASHLVAWDGSVIHERPKKLRVNNTSDRLETNSIDVFNRLYHPRNYRCWQITSVYELVLV